MKPFLIFLVDDDPIYLKMMEETLIDKKYLFRYNYEIKTFQAGELCLDNLHLRPDIVILDYQLDTKYYDANNGLEILKKINSVEYSVNLYTKVIMLSSQDKLQIADALHIAGAYEYIIKSETAFLRIKNAVGDIFDNIENEQREKQEKFRNKIYRTIIIVSYVILLGIIKYLYSKANL